MRSYAPVGAIRINDDANGNLAWQRFYFCLARGGEHIRANGERLMNGDAKNKNFFRRLGFVSRLCREIIPQKNFPLVSRVKLSLR